MGPLVAVTCGSVFGLGALLVVAGVRGRSYLPPSDRVARRLFGDDVGRDTALLTMTVAFVAAMMVLTMTGWPVAAVGAAVSVVLLRRGFGMGRDHQHYVARTNAIATWAELVRDNMAGAAGLEQALQAGVGVAPQPVEHELQRFAANLDQMSLVESLRRLGDDLDHPSADLVVAALTNAAVMEVRELGPLLGRLADATRADTRMRERVEVGRARIRTSARIVVGTTVLTIGLLWLFARNLLVAYDSVAGQLWMCVVAAIFVVGGTVLRNYSRFEMPQRFRARRAPTTGPVPPAMGPVPPAMDPVQ